jgi:uncharacterized membrane protein
MNREDFILNERKMILGLILISTLLVSYIVIRIIFTGGLSKVFLVWNLFLAWIPIILIYFTSEKTKKVWLPIILILWIMFFPNTPYLITDLKHLNHSLPFIEYWLDLFILSITSLLGFLLTVFAIFQIKNKLSYFIPKKLTSIFIIFIIIVSGFGVFLGRFERLNSWHIITNTKEVFNTTINVLKTIVNEPKNLIFVLLFSLTIGFLYLIVNLVNKKDR